MTKGARAAAAILVGYGVKGLPPPVWRIRRVIAKGALRPRPSAARASS